MLTSEENKQVGDMDSDDVKAALEEILRKLSYRKFRGGFCLAFRVCRYQSASRI